VLLWELETEDMPFRDLVDEKELRKIVCEENLRPSIPKETNEYLASLIRDCWKTKPDMRPNFDTICRVLERVQFN
jgi:hypothetical protein